MDKPLKVLDLFSGIGGFSYGLEILCGGYETIGFCEYDKKCQELLKLRWPGVPIYPDIRELTGDGIKTDIITGGYPCQPFSAAGKRAGEEDDRHLWPEMYRIIKTIKPRWVIAENVAGHISMGLDAVLSDLEAENYTCWPFVIPACAVDARHRRDRVWIAANSESKLGDRKGQGGFQSELTQCGEDVANAPLGGRRKGYENNGGAFEGEGEKGERIRFTNSGENRMSAIWPVEPSVGRVANGVSNRVDRLKQLGNSIVPQVVAVIGRAILEAEASRVAI